MSVRRIIMSVMKFINHLGATGTAGYNQGLMLAAHYGAGRSARYDIWLTPTTGPARKITDTDPLYRAAAKEINQAGGLEIGEKASWENENGKFVARRA